jgi:hypothetical protein
MTRMFRYGAFVLLLGCAAASLGMINPAAAQSQGTAAQRAACEGDAFRFCSEYIPFVHMIENCLSKNVRKLSPACQSQIRGTAPVTRVRR